MCSEFKGEIEEIMQNMDCPKDFICHKSDFEDLCEFKDFDIGSFVECEASCDHSPTTCPFGLHFGCSYFCICPLRVFVAKKMRK